jgi:hypothetical protein
MPTKIFSTASKNWQRSGLQQRQLFTDGLQQAKH